MQTFSSEDNLHEMPFTVPRKQLEIYLEIPSCLMLGTLGKIFRVRHTETLLTYPREPDRNSRANYLHRRQFARNAISRPPGTIRNISHVFLSCLMLGILVKIFRVRHTETPLTYPKRTRPEPSCKLSPLETICMKCHFPSCGNNEKYTSRSHHINTWHIG